MSAWDGWLFGNEPIAWIQQLFGLGHPLPFRILSLLGDTWGIVFVVGIGLWLFGRRTLHALVGIVVAGAATKLVMFEMFNQTRPRGPGIVVYEHLDLSSFPSGHVFAAVGPWGLLYALGHVRLWVPVTVAAGVAVGRIYLGTHYLGDVIGGFVFGAVLVWLYHRLWPGIYRWLAARGEMVGMVAAVLVIAGTVAVWALEPDVHARRYEIYGMTVAAAIALPLERRGVRYEPGSPSAARGAARVALGLFGIGALLLWDRSASEDALMLGALTAGLAVLWALLGAPALFEALRPGGRGLSS